jgi:hypothetical protein
LEQIEPFAQTVPQQGWPTAPHAAQVFPVPQIAPALQVVPQQGWVAPPQAAHLLVDEEHKNPVAQLEPAQHGCALPPQFPQVPPEHTSPLLLQTPPQQGWPVSPQAVQVPAAQA